MKSRTHGSSGGKGPRGPYLSQFFHASEQGVKKAHQLVVQWLAGMGLELKASKTSFTHTLKEYQGKCGFDFLGFTVRQYQVGKFRTGTNQHRKPLGFKTIITPSQTAIKGHLEDLARVVHAHRSTPQQALIGKLNPIIRGWANYFRTVISKKVFSECDHLLYLKLRRWARRRHPRKDGRWVTGKYWAVDQGQGWRFMTPDGKHLRKHAATSITRHTKVSGKASPYDGRLVYWAKRLKDHPLTNTDMGHLLKQQNGVCPYCGEYFKDGDAMEIDHILPTRLGGWDRLFNKQVLHCHCHDQKTTQDGSRRTESGSSVSLTRTTD